MPRINFTVSSIGNFYAVIKAGNQWVACGYDGSLITSPDAIHWTLRETGTDHELFALASTPDGLWVAGEGGTILSSITGLSDSDQDGLADSLGWPCALMPRGVDVTIFQRQDARNG